MMFSLTPDNSDCKYLPSSSDNETDATVHVTVEKTGGQSTLKRQSRLTWTAVLCNE